MGSIGTWGLYVSGEPGLVGGEPTGRASSGAEASERRRVLPWELPYRCIGVVPRFACQMTQVDGQSAGAGPGVTMPGVAEFLAKQHRYRSTELEGAAPQP